MKDRLLYVPMAGYYAVVDRYLGGLTLENITSGHRMEMPTEAYKAALEQHVGEVD
jgi:hypothetical protein